MLINQIIENERKSKEGLDPFAAQQTRMLETSIQADKKPEMIKLALAGADDHPSLARRVVIVFNSWHNITIQERHATELAKSNVGYSSFPLVVQHHERRKYHGRG